MNKYNNTYYSTIKMKFVNVKDDRYIDFDKEGNNKNLKFQLGDHIGISKYQNIFAKTYTPNWYEENFTIKKVKNTIPWTYIIGYLDAEEIVRTLYEKELQKPNQEEFRIEKAIKKKQDKLYGKWKGYDKRDVV